MIYFKNGVHSLDNTSKICYNELRRNEQNGELLHNAAGKLPDWRLTSAIYNLERNREKCVSLLT